MEHVKDWASFEEDDVDLEIRVTETAEIKNRIFQFSDEENEENEENDDQDEEFLEEELLLNSSVPRQKPSIRQSDLEALLEAERADLERKRRKTARRMRRRMQRQIAKATQLLDTLDVSSVSKYLELYHLWVSVFMFDLKRDKKSDKDAKMKLSDDESRSSESSSESSGFESDDFANFGSFDDFGNPAVAKKEENTEDTPSLSNRISEDFPNGYYKLSEIEAMDVEEDRVRFEEGRDDFDDLDVDDFEFERVDAAEMISTEQRAAMEDELFRSAMNDWEKRLESQVASIKEDFALMSRDHRYQQH